MPTVLREKGYRVGFYNSESEDQAHVHVTRETGEARFWLSPVQLSWNKGFRESQLKEVTEILEAHETELIEAWNEIE